MSFNSQDIAIDGTIICVVAIIAAAIVVSNYNDNQAAAKMAALNYEQQLVDGNRIWVRVRKGADKAEK